MRKYLARHGERVEERDGLLSFTIPKETKEVADRLHRADPYEARREVKEPRVTQATVDKARSRSSGARLLRFGDPIFEAMVRHVQGADFSSGTASLELPAELLGWSQGTRGTLTVFDLKVKRQEGLEGARILRQHMLPVLVPHGGAPQPAEGLLEQLHQALPGNLAIDADEVQRAYGLAKQIAETEGQRLLDGCVQEFSSPKGLLPQTEDYAMAWVTSI